MNRRKLANRAAWWLYSPVGPLLARRFPTLAAMVEQVRRDWCRVKGNG